MSDLPLVLPDFDVKPYSRLIHSLEQKEIPVSDLLTLDPTEIVRKCPLPLLELRRLVKDVIEACQVEAGIKKQNQSTSDGILASTNSKVDSTPWYEFDKLPHLIKTLDPAIDAALDGGIYTGYITEVAGESAAGKTQFVLSLLLAAQLPTPHGLCRGAIYLSTESPLSTSRLHQMRESHPFYKALPAEDRPSLDSILTIPVNDLEAQDHIIEFQLPVAVKRYNIGLVVIDSVAANYRAEHSTKNLAGLADRATEIAKLGAILRRIATEDNVAVVVTNQVSDRFDDPTGRMIPTQDLLRTSSPGFSSSPAQNQQSSIRTPARLESIMSLDHQSRFFTGWGQERAQPNRPEALKTPTLGLAWTNQIAARIVLKMVADRAVGPSQQGQGGNIWTDRKKRRFFNVVFCPWAPATAIPVEYQIKMEGLVSVDGAVVQQVKDEDDTFDGVKEGEHEDLLREELWGFDGAGEDEEFPL